MPERNKVKRRAQPKSKYKNENENPETEAIHSRKQFNRKNKSKNNEQRSFFKTKTGIFIIFLSLGLILATIVILLKSSSNGEETVGKLLRINIDFCNDMLLYQQQISIFLLGERLANALKEKLGPVQQKVTSLRTQTSQYEKMERIPGGPTKFIEDALKELEDISDNQLSAIDIHVYPIIADESQQSKALLESLHKIFVQSIGPSIFEIYSNPKLTNEGIFLLPTASIDDGQFVENMMTKVTLDEILTALTVLADKFEEHEITVKKIEKVKKDLGIENFWDIELDPNDESQEEIKKLMAGYMEERQDLDFEISKNEILYQLLVPLRTQAMDKISDLQHALVNYSENKRRGYLNLRATLEKDVAALKLRILNLRYKYAKHTSKSI